MFCHYFQSAWKTPQRSWELLYNTIFKRARGTRSFTNLLYVFHHTLCCQALGRCIQHLSLLLNYNVLMVVFLDWSTNISDYGGSCFGNCFSKVCTVSCIVVRMNATSTTRCFLANLTDLLSSCWCKHQMTDSRLVSFLIGLSWEVLLTWEPNKEACIYWLVYLGHR